MKYIISILFFVGNLFAQCQFPPGVTVRAGSTTGCNEVTNDPVMGSSLLSSPRIGSNIIWTWQNPPNISPVCPNVPGYVFISTGFFQPGARIPGTTDPNCILQVLPDIIVNVRVPFCQGCHGQFFIGLPLQPILVGVTFHAQTIAWSSPPLRYTVGRVLQITIQP